MQSKGALLYSPAKSMREFCEAATPDDRNLSFRLSHGGISDTATRDAHRPGDGGPAPTEAERRTTPLATKSASIPVDFASTTTRVVSCRGYKVERISLEFWEEKCQ